MTLHKFIPLNIFGEAAEVRYTYLLREYDGAIAVGTISKWKKKRVLLNPWRLEIRVLYKKGNIIIIYYMI